MTKMEIISALKDLGLKNWHQSEDEVGTWYCLETIGSWGAVVWIGDKVVVGVHSFNDTFGSTLAPTVFELSALTDVNLVLEAFNQRVSYCNSIKSSEAKSVMLYF